MDEKESNNVQQVQNAEPEDQDNEASKRGKGDGQIVNRDGSKAGVSTDEIKEMYKELGVKASVPTGKTRGRPKSADVRDKDTDAENSKNSSNGDKKDGDDKNDSKNASSASHDGDSGDKVDASGKKVGEDSGKVSGESKDANGGAGQDKSDSDEGSEGGGKGGPEDGDGESGESDQVKRPGKSNPEVERRFQKLTSDIKARDSAIESLRAQLAEVTNKSRAERDSIQDPEYSINDFRTVVDNNTGEIRNLDPDEAELAYRRWKEGYDVRNQQRQQQYAQESARVAQEQQSIQRVMKESSDAYDSLASLLDEYPALNEKSDKFDKSLSDMVVPMITGMVEYLPGTEPGNANNRQPVIVGMKADPRQMLKAINAIQQSKRTIPVNGISGDVDGMSNISVHEARSSDDMVNAANALYKELNIKKRL